MIENKRIKSCVLVQIALQVAKNTKDFDKVIKVICSLSDEEEVVYILKRIAYSLLEKGDLQRTLATVLIVPNVQDKYFGLVDISTVIKDVDKKKQFNSMVLGYLLKDLEKISDRRVADICIDAVARGLICQEDFEQGLKLTKFYYDLSKRDELYEHAATRYSCEGDFEKAVEIAQKIVDGGLRENAFDFIYQDMIYQMKPKQEASDVKEDEVAFLEFSKAAFRGKSS
ncbi:MAG: hypothetical protein P0S96_05410 [Simkaniaceae bacterium]|nr:hypothetical protein [Candidatus Sacchlamyda saccharinae]